MICKVHTPKAGPIDYWDANEECDDCRQLLDAASDAIAIARRVGVPKYGPSSWCDISVQEHLNHAIAHARLAYNMKHTDGEDHLSHAICRLAMARALTDGS